jgi:hypothetical protein
MYALFASLMLATTVAADAPADKNRSNFRSMPVVRTPEATTVVLAISVPKEGQVVSHPVWIQFRIDGFALGAASSQFERAAEVVNSNMGQTVHVIIDDRPYFPVNEPAIDPFDEGGFYYDMSYKFQVPFRLKEGMHTIRMFPARSFGECLKGDKTFQAMTFYVGSQKEDSNIDLSTPYITYNEPSNELYLVENRPVLLDFYVSNTELSPDGYKVRLTIDGKFNRMLQFWQPYYIYGLKKGKHTVRLELIDPNGQLVPGPFNDIQQKFTVH